MYTYVSLVKRKRRTEVHTHANNVALNVVAKGQVAGDGNKDVHRGSRPDARANDADKTCRRVILDLVDDGEHLNHVSKHSPITKTQTLTF